jgi:titin
VFINGAPDNTIGGTSVAARNVISGNGSEGVLINGAAATNVLVHGNYIGLGEDGATVIPNNGDGVRIASSSGNSIGGTSTSMRNVISANGAVGVDILDPSSTNNLVRGNYIGTDASGTQDRGNALEGVYVNGGVNNAIGGSGVGSRNIISGNLHGVGLNDAAAQNNQIAGNFIGTNAFGTGPVANTFDGVRVAGSASNNVVGGSAGLANVIAYNGGDGVFLDQTAGTGNRINQNQIFLNGQLGIDIFPNGVTHNDVGDPDLGPNNVQNFPVLTSANSTLAGTTIQGTLNSLPSTSFTVQVFSDSSCDPSGNGEGQLFVGTVVVNTDGSGNGSFNQLFPTVVANAHVVNATATDPNGNTSEFSACRSVAGVAQPPLKQGDVNCDTNVNSVDALLVLRYASGLSVAQTEPCPDIGTVISQVIGDVDCTGVVNSVDALKILRFGAGLSVTQTEPCVDIGLVFP